MKKVEKIIDDAVKEMAEKGNDQQKAFVLSRLADVAIADGKLMKPEAGIIFDIAKELGFQEKTAYAIVVEAMNSVGLAIDYKMNTLVRGIKDQLLARY